MNERIATFAVLLGCVLGFTVRGTSWQTVVDGTSFNSVSAFTGSWSYNYPWGTDHNGSARMNATNVTVSGGVVTLTSSLTNSYEGTSSASPYLTIRYNSGTFYLNTQITISQNYPIWDISGQFKVPTQTGCWPAFWMTGANSWPPESDFMEFKGGAGCSQNTYNGSWQGLTTTVSTAGTAWHTYRLVACLENSTNVDFHYYIDGVMKSEQTSTTFVNAPCWLIIDFQMEGSSGSPGPSYTTYTYVTNIVVKRLNAIGSGSGPVTNGACKILSASTGDALDVGNQSTADNSTLDQWPYNAGLNQQYVVTYLGNGKYAIMGRQSGRALQVTDAATTNGAIVSLMDYTNGSNQQWLLATNSTGNCTLMNMNSGKMMEVADNSAANFALIDQWSPGNSTFPLVNSVSTSETNLFLSGSNGIPGITYLWLTSTDVTSPLSNWTSAANVVLDRAGNFASSIEMASDMPGQFYMLALQANGATNQEWSFQSP